jgi:alanyl-tRNA synthetase
MKRFWAGTFFLYTCCYNKKAMKQYDPQMHTTEHILNQTMIRMFGCERSFSMHLEKKKSKCDFHFDRPLTGEEEQLIQDKVNRVIALGLPVKEKHIDMSEAGALFDISKLPEQSIDSVRIVEVGGYDSCPCIGEHVANTSEIGNFHITTTSYEDGVLRIRFKIDR